jgi:hypothetical protein
LSSDNPLRVAATTMGLLAGGPALIAAILLLGFGHMQWASGIVAGWLVGMTNALLLARRVNLVADQRSSSGFLFGMTSRFALIGLLFLGGYKLAAINPIAFVIGFALVSLMGVPWGLWFATRNVGR